LIGNLELLSRLLIAALLGSVIGFERERRPPLAPRPSS
jgi:putative Mg2+ transporter-C (MgtC) family protein